MIFHCTCLLDIMALKPCDIYSITLVHVDRVAFTQNTLGALNHYAPVVAPVS